MTIFTRVYSVILHRAWSPPWKTDRVFLNDRSSQNKVNGVKITAGLTVHAQDALKLLGILHPFIRIALQHHRREHLEIHIRHERKLVQAGNMVFVSRITGELGRSGSERRRKKAGYTVSCTI